MTVAVGKDVVLKYDGEKRTFPRKEIPSFSTETCGVYKAIASGTAQSDFNKSMADLGKNVMWLDTNFSSEKWDESGRKTFLVSVLTILVAAGVFGALLGTGVVSTGIYFAGAVGLPMAVFLIVSISWALIERDGTESLNSHANLFDAHYDTFKSGLEKQLASQRAAMAEVLATDASIPPESLRQLEDTLKALDELEKARKFFETLRSQGQGKAVS